MAFRPQLPEGTVASNRLVLCMIVRDESAVIGRCLDSCLPLVDGFVICDTGSVDDTPALISNAAADADVPGRITSHEWRDFGHNRTLAVTEARRWVEERGWPLERTYLLLLDADMVLHVDPSFSADSLEGMACTVEQDDGVVRYANTRLLRLSEEWEAVGPTHEYWRPLGVEIDERPLGSLLIEDRGDGGSKSDKYERDIVLLRGALAEEPENARNVFYLAQSFFDSGRLSEAAEWYGRRWQMGGWDEERWYAKYREGVALLALGEAERGAGTLLDAFAARPGRAEPLWVLAHHYREAGKYHPALMLALQGLEIPYPQDDVLFIERHVYEWRLWEEVMISATQAGERYLELAREACRRLRSRPGHEPWFYEYVAAWESAAGFSPAVREDAGPLRGDDAIEPSESVLAARFPAPVTAGKRRPSNGRSVARPRDGIPSLTVAP